MDDPDGFGGDDDGTFVPFTDILFNTLLGFVILVFIAFALIRPSDKTGDIDVKAEFIITVTWPDSNPDDIDTYVQDPEGNIVWYETKDKGFMTLDRDDRGNYLDQETIGGKVITFPLNQETVSIRRNVPGEYIVNVYHYTNPSNQPVPVNVKVEKINPKVTVVYSGTVTLAHKGDEKTAVRFTIDPDGNVTGLGFRPVSLVDELRK